MDALEPETGTRLKTTKEDIMEQICDNKANSDCNAFFLEFMQHSKISGREAVDLYIKSFKERFKELCISKGVTYDQRPADDRPPSLVAPSPPNILQTAAELAMDDIDKRNREETVVNLNGCETAEKNNQSEDEQPHEEAASPEGRARFLRRFSLQGYLASGKRQVLSIFRKQQSDEVELSFDVSGINGGSQQQDFTFNIRPAHKKPKFRIQVECVKEGIVKFTSGDISAIDGKPQWERSKMALVKVAGGQMLIFCTPPKSSKPKAGVFCFLISEARETTALEMPDHDNTFVLKTENEEGSLEFLIEAVNNEDMKLWLLTIQSAMRPQGLCLAELAERSR